MATVPPGLSRARAGVLERLDESGFAVSVAQVAATTGLHPNTAREHLDGLVDAGLAARVRATPVGRGRPAWLYRTASSGRHGQGAEYAGLARALVDQLARSSPDPRADALQAGRRWGADLARSDAAGRASAGRTPAGRRRALVGLLADLHFDPLANREATTVRLRTCPILDAARAHPEIVCGVHLGIVGGALEEWGESVGRPRSVAGDGGGEGEGVELVPFAEPGACLLTLSP